MENSKSKNLNFTISFLALLLFINFTFTACEVNKDLKTESVDKTSTYITKADLKELINKIGDRDLKLIELIKNNPVSELKTTSFQKTAMVSSEYYFDTDNIMSLKNDTNQAVYIIPVYKSSNAKDNKIYSISININDDFIDTKLNILQLKEDGTEEYISRNFEYTKTSSKTSKTKDLECYCTVYTTGGVSQGTGWEIPQDIAVFCSSCSGSGSGWTNNDFGTTTGNTTGTNVTLSTVWANGGGGSYGYAYNYTGDKIYIDLTKIYNLEPKHVFTQLEKYNIINTPNITNLLLQFLEIDGGSQMNKNFGLSTLKAIEEGTITNEEEFNVLLNAYKSAQEFLAFKKQFFIDNPTTTEAQFENWFMGQSEGQDGEYDAAFWEDPNLTFPQQNLPSFNDFKNNCPSKYTTGETLCNTLGGGLLTMYNNNKSKNIKLNTCAIRISRALMLCGIIIPSLPDNANGTKNTEKDKDGNNYIISAKGLNEFMKKTFGTNPPNYYHFNKSQAGVKGTNFQKLITGKQGIYSMVSKPEIQQKWGTGHADLLENGECWLKCHFYDETNQFVPVEYIDIWILN